MAVLNSGFYPFNLIFRPTSTSNVQEYKGSRLKRVKPKPNMVEEKMVTSNEMFFSDLQGL